MEANTSKAGGPATAAADHIPIGLGFTVGTSALGWAVVALDKGGVPMAMLDCGVHTFSAPENPKNYETLNKERREKRLLRRVNHRKAVRREKLRSVFCETGVLTKEEVDGLPDETDDIYKLWAQALDRPLTNVQFARIMLLIAKRRGFAGYSEKRTEKSAAKDGALLTAVGENERRMEENGYRTVGEMLYLDPVFAQSKRNHGGDYKNVVLRSRYRADIKAIFAAQRGFGMPFASEEIEAKVIEVFDYAYGASRSDNIASMVGPCGLLPGKKRAPTASYTYERYVFLQHIANIRIISSFGSRPLTKEEKERLYSEAFYKTTPLTFDAIRTKILKGSVGIDEVFNYCRYEHYLDVESAEKKERIIEPKKFRALRAAINSGYAELVGKKTSTYFEKNITGDMVDRIAEVMGYYKDEDEAAEQLLALGLDDFVVDAIFGSGVDFAGFGSYSLEAYGELADTMERDDCDYYHALMKFYDDHPETENVTRTRKLKILPAESIIQIKNNHVVQRSVAQLSKVYNAIIDRYGVPVYVNFQTMRDVTKNPSQRLEIDKQNRMNEKSRAKAAEALAKEFPGVRATGNNIMKLRLYDEQKGIDPLTQQPIDRKRLFEPTYAYIGHIVPLSMCYNDSMSNKFVSTSDAVVNKRDQLPLNYLEGAKRDAFIAWVKENVADAQKRFNYLRETVDFGELRELANRMLNDNGSIATFLSNYMATHLEFDSLAGIKRHVYTIPGKVISFMERRWGMRDLGAYGLSNLAVDAAVIACVNRSLAFKASDYLMRSDDEDMEEKGSAVVQKESEKVVYDFPYPYAGFRDDLRAHLSADPVQLHDAIKDISAYKNGLVPMPVKPFFVTRRPDRGVSGAVHNDTVYSSKFIDEKIMTVRKPLTSLTIKDGNLCFCSKSQKKIKKTEDGSFDVESLNLTPADVGCPDRGYVVGAMRDKGLHDAIVGRLIQFGGNGPAAFEQPFMYNGRLIRKVQIGFVSGGNMMSILGGVVTRDTLIRLDVFYVKEKRRDPDGRPVGEGYHYVPIYAGDAVPGKPLPIRSCRTGQNECDWPILNDDEFCFSVYKNDLLHITFRKPEGTILKLKKTYENCGLPAKISTGKDNLFYFFGFGRSTNSFNLRSVNGLYENGCSMKGVVAIEKMDVGLLGDIHPVKGKCQRVGFDKKQR